MKKISIAGAGFSGLTLAYQLQKHGFEVEIFEAASRAGGMVHSFYSDYGLVECAANAILADKDIEDLFNELNVSVAEQKAERKNRYIYWKAPRRWPLTVLTTAKLTWMMGKVKFGRDEIWPKAQETIFDWSNRVVNGEFEQRLLSPALQGVFAGDPKRLSATLTLASLLGGRAPKGKLRGSIAPRGGMVELIEALTKKIQAEGGKIQYGKEFDVNAIEGPKVLATNAWNAAKIAAPKYPELADKLRHCESLTLVTATCFYEPNARDLKGFGCLFPVGQGFKATGVVFNDCVFSNRSKVRSETWILGGALEPGIIGLNDEEIAEIIAKDRAKLMNNGAPPLEIKITRWPHAIPHYTIQWEKILKSIELPEKLYLHGNYLGGIGLSRIYQRSVQLAQQIKDDNGS